MMNFLLLAAAEKKIEAITPKYAEQCEDIRKKMRKLVDEYLSECSESN